MTTRAWLAVALCAALTAPLLAQGGRGGSRTPVRDRPAAAAAATGTATLGGRITSPEGTPLRRAQVQLTAGEGGAVRGTTTDNDGRYRFAQLPAGRYTVRASKPGFVGLAYGQRSTNAAVPPIIVGDDEALTALNIMLPRGSAITGRVTDEFGDPVLQAQVQALRYQYQPDGTRTLVAAGMQASTDDLGQFRLYGLTPGDYVISASVRTPFVQGNARVSQDEPDEGYAPTYYPGTSNAASAQPITVGLGQELSIPLQLVPARLSRIAGIVVDSQGRPLPQGTPVMLRPAAAVGGAGFGFRAANVSGPDGAFSVAAVPPGDYLLDVRPRRGGRGGGGQTSAVDDEFALVPVSVGGGDITGLRIATGKGATLSGRVLFEGTPPAPGTRIRVVPQPSESAAAVPLAMRNGQDDGLVGADGAFTVTNITGPVLLRITIEGTRAGDTLGYMTKSVVIDGVDLADIPFDPSRRGTVTGVTLVVTDRIASVTGMVSTASGGVGEPATVLIVPESLPADASPMRFVRALRADANGHFEVRGLPAGRYAAVAVSGFDLSHQYDPEVIGRARLLGRRFSLQEGESVALDLRPASDF